MKKLLIILAIFIGAFSISHDVLAAPVISASQLSQDYQFIYPGIIAGQNTGIATSSHFSLSEDLVPTSIQFLAAPVAGATSTTVSLSCGGSAYAYWVVDMTFLGAYPNNLSLVVQSSPYMPLGNTRPLGVTDCFLNFVTGNQLEAFQQIPKNTFTGGDAGQHPYFLLYTGSPLPDNFPIQLPAVVTASAFNATTTQQYCNSNFSSSTNPIFQVGNDIAVGICNVGVSLFVPSLDTITSYAKLSSTTQEKIPFSYYFDVKEIYDGSVASSTQNMQSFSINLSAFDSSSSTPMGAILPTNLNFFSTTTINKFLPAGMHDIIYNIMTYAIWVEVMYLIYRRIVPKHAKI